MNENDPIKNMFWKAGFICLRLKPIMYRVRGQDGYIDVFPVLNKFKRYGAPEHSDDLVATCLQYLTPYEPSVTPELAEHRDRLDCLSAEIQMKALSTRRSVAPSR